MSPIPTNIPKTHMLNFVIFNIFRFYFLFISITTFLSFCDKELGLFVIDKYSLHGILNRLASLRRHHFPTLFVEILELVLMLFLASFSM